VEARRPGSARDPDRRAVVDVHRVPLGSGRDPARRAGRGPGRLATGASVCRTAALDAGLLLMEVREARGEDWPAVAALLAELGRPDVVGTPEEEASRELFLRYLERDDAVALVAEDGGQVVGFIDLEFRPR